MSIYRGLERVGSWVPGGSVGGDQLAMAAKVRRHWFNPCRLGSRGHLGADFSLLLYTDLIKKRKPSRYFTDEGELIRKNKLQFLSKYSLSEVNFNTHGLLIEFNGLWYSLAARQVFVAIANPDSLSFG